MKFRIALSALALLVFAMGGVAGAQPTYCPYGGCGRGTLVFTHAIPAETLGPVDVVLYPGGVIEFQHSLGVVAPGGTLQADLQETPPGRGNYYDGNHRLVLADPSTHARTGPETYFEIVPGGTTTVVAQLNAEGEPELVVSMQPPPPETASPRPQTVTVPTRVETGAGGSAAEGARALVLGGLAAAAAVALLVGNLRRPDAAGHAISPGRPANGGPDRGRRPRNSRN